MKERLYRCVCVYVSGAQVQGCPRLAGCQVRTRPLCKRTRSTGHLSQAVVDTAVWGCGGNMVSGVCNSHVYV